MVEQRRAARDRRSRMRRAGRPAIKRLSGGEELIADAAAVVIRLRDAGLDVRAGRDDVGFDATVAARRIDGAAARKPMMSLALSAPVLPMPQPSFPVWRKFSPAPTEMMFLAVPGLLTVLDPGSVVAGREDHDQLLIAGDAALRVAHDAVNFLRVGVVAEEI